MRTIMKRDGGDIGKKLNVSAKERDGGEAGKKLVVSAKEAGANRFKLDKHTVILGSSGSGKTYFGSWCLENAVVTPYAIFINTQNEIDVERMCDVTVRNYDELEDYVMSHRKGKINYVVAKDLDTILEQISEIQMLLFAIGDKVNKRKITKWVTVFFDEIQIMSGKGGKYNTVDEFFTRGRRQGIVCVGVSQRPALVSQTVLTQSLYKVYFYFDEYEDPYFKRYGIDLNQYQDWLDKPFHFLIVKPHFKKKVKPIKL